MISSRPQRSQSKNNYNVENTFNELLTEDYGLMTPPNSSSSVSDFKPSLPTISLNNTEFFEDSIKFEDGTILEKNDFMYCISKVGQAYEIVRIMNFKKVNNQILLKVNHFYRANAFNFDDPYCLYGTLYYSYQSINNFKGKVEVVYKQDLENVESFIKKQNRFYFEKFLETSFLVNFKLVKTETFIEKYLEDFPTSFKEILLKKYKFLIFENNFNFRKHLKIGKIIKKKINQLSLNSLAELKTRSIDDWYFGYCGTDANLYDLCDIDSLPNITFRSSNSTFKKNALEDFPISESNRGGEETVIPIYIPTNDETIENSRSKLLEQEVKILEKRLKIRTSNIDLIDKVLNGLYVTSFNIKKSRAIFNEISKKTLNEPEFSKTEILNFEEAIKIYKIDIGKIQKFVKTQNTAACIRFYYSWKNSPRAEKILNFINDDVPIYLYDYICKNCGRGKKLSTKWYDGFGNLIPPKKLKGLGWQALFCENCVGKCLLYNLFDGIKRESEDEEEEKKVKKRKV